MCTITLHIRHVKSGVWVCPSMTTEHLFCRYSAAMASPLFLWSPEGMKRITGVELGMRLAVNNDRDLTHFIAPTSRVRGNGLTGAAGTETDWT